MPRRSARIAAKAPITYSEPVEEIDEVTKEHVQTMFDVLLEESYEKVTKPSQLRYVFKRCVKEFRAMFADLNKENPTRRAVEELMTSLTGDHYLYEYDHELYSKTQHRFDAANEDMFNKRMSIMAEELKPLVELVMQYKALTEKIFDETEKARDIYKTLNPQPGMSRTMARITCLGYALGKEDATLCNAIDYLIRTGSYKRLY